MSSRDNHWFDQLGAPRTRRSVILKGLVAGAVLTLPSLFNPTKSHASNPNSRGDAHACQKGCTTTAILNTDDRLGTCASNASQSYLGTVPLQLYFGTGAITAAAAFAYATKMLCEDRAILREKADLWDCRQPDCPGFDPESTNGPCRICTASGTKCCPDPGSPSGYQCCAICCSPSGKGCGAGATECGK